MADLLKTMIPMLLLMLSPIMIPLAVGGAGLGARSRVRL